MEAENPSWYIPKKKTKHRPPQKKTKLLTEEVTNQKGKGKRKQN